MSFIPSTILEFNILQIVDMKATIFLLSDLKSWLFGKDSDDVKDCGQEEKRVAEDEMVR